MVVLLGFNSSPSRVIFLKTFPSSAILYRSVKFPGKAQTHSPFLHTKQILNIDRLVTCIKPLKCTLLNFLCKITGGQLTVAPPPCKFWLVQKTKNLNKKRQLMIIGNNRLLVPFCSPDALKLRILIKVYIRVTLVNCHFCFCLFFNAWPQHFT